MNRFLLDWKINTIAGIPFTKTIGKHDRIGSKIEFDVIHLSAIVGNAYVDISPAAVPATGGYINGKHSILISDISDEILYDIVDYVSSELWDEFGFWYVTKIRLFLFFHWLSMKLSGQWLVYPSNWLSVLFLQLALQCVIAIYREDYKSYSILLEKVSMETIELIVTFLKERK